MVTTIQSCLIIALLITLIELKPNNCYEDFQHSAFNPPPGMYNFGYVISETGQFHFERRGPDNVTYTCKGYATDGSPPQIKYYVTDALGHREFEERQSIQIFPVDTDSFDIHAWNQIYLHPGCSEITFRVPNNSSSPTFRVAVPYDDGHNPADQLTVEIRAIEDVCFQLLRLPSEYRQLAASFQYPDVHHVHCLLRCVGILGRFSADESGPNLDVIWQKLYLEAGSFISKEDFYADTQKCYAAIPKTVAPPDICDKNYLAFKCFWWQYNKAIGGPDISD